MLTRTPDEVLPNPGKAVPSLSQDAQPRDLSADLARHRAGNDARMTVPGGYPQTVGGNPDPPADRQVSDEEDTGVAVSAPGPYSQSTKWVGGGVTNNGVSSGY